MLTATTYSGQMLCGRFQTRLACAGLVSLGPVMEYAPDSPFLWGPGLDLIREKS